MQNQNQNQDNFVVMSYDWATAPGRRYDPQKNRIETAAGWHIAYPVSEQGDLYQGVRVSRTFYSN